MTMHYLQIVLTYTQIKGTHESGVPQPVSFRGGGDFQITFTRYDI